MRNFSSKGRAVDYYTFVVSALRQVRIDLTSDEDSYLYLIEGGHADHRILECAVEASADYLVTGDRRKLLPIGEHEGAKILNTPRFLSTLGHVR